MAQTMLSEKPATKQPESNATKKHVSNATKNLGTKYPATKHIAQADGLVDKNFLKSVPKKLDRLVDWMTAHIVEVCSTSKETQRAIFDRLCTWEFTPMFVSVLEAVNNLDADTSATKDVLRQFILRVLNRTSISRWNYANYQIERVHELGYLELSELSPYFVSEAFAAGTTDSVKTAIWAFTHGATMAEKPQHAWGKDAVHLIDLVDLEAANTADAFLTSQGIVHTFTFGLSRGPRVKSWKECLPFIDWAKEHNVKLPGNMWKWYDSSAWLKWLDSKGLMPAKNARKIEYFHSQSKTKVKLLQTHYGFTLDKAPTFSQYMRCVPDIAAYKYHADPAKCPARLSGPMPETSVGLVAWIGGNLDVILGSSDLQTSLNDRLFDRNTLGYNLEISTEVLDALTPRGVHVLKPGLLEHLSSRPWRSIIPADVVQRMHTEGVFTLADLSSDITTRGFENGRLEAVKMAIWLFKTGKPIQVSTTFGYLSAFVCDVEGATLMRDFFAEHNINHRFTMAMYMFEPDPSAEEMEKIKSAVDWFMAHSLANPVRQYASAELVRMKLVRMYSYGVQWLSWLAEKNYLPKNRLIRRSDHISSRSPAYWAELVRLGFTESYLDTTLHVHYTPSNLTDLSGSYLDSTFTVQRTPNVDASGASV